MGSVPCHLMLFCFLLLCVCSFQLSPKPRTSRSDLTLCTSTPTRRRHSAMTAGRCCGGSSDRASNVKVTMWKQDVNKRPGGEFNSPHGHVMMSLWLTPAVTLILNQITSFSLKHIQLKCWRRSLFEMHPACDWCMSVCTDQVQYQATNQVVVDEHNCGRCLWLSISLQLHSEQKKRFAFHQSRVKL